MSDDHEDIHEIHLYYECPICFLNFSQEHKGTIQDAIKNNLDIEVRKCDFCENRRWLERNGRDLLNRILEVTPKSKASRMPEILKLMVSGLKWDDNE
jgi:hypothetical protein